MQLSRFFPFPGVPGPMRARKRRLEDSVSLFVRYILSSRIKNEMEKVTATINDDTTMSKFAENGMPQPYEATGINNTNESWTSEHVMQILELGQRQWYKTNEHQPDNSVRMNITRNYDKYIYEEVENPESFFLPYIWSMTYDSTPDIWWDANRILLFPMVFNGLKS